MCFTSVNETSLSFTASGFSHDDSSRSCAPKDAVRHQEQGKPIFQNTPCASWGRLTSLHLPAAGALKHQHNFLLFLTLAELLPAKLKLELTFLCWHCLQEGRCPHLAESHSASGEEQHLNDLPWHPDACWSSLSPRKVDCIYILCLIFGNTVFL